MERLVFIDTETTSLRHDRRIWDVGLITRENGLQIERQMFVDASDLDLGNADPFSLKVGRFYDRHPNMLVWNAELRAQMGSERAVMQEIESITRGAHLIGAIVSFDAEGIAARMRACGIAPSWHHHLIDIEALCVGYLSGLGLGLVGTKGERPAIIAPPWRSDELTKAMGVESAPETDRHTAIGDARWAMRMYDKVMGR